MDEGVVGTSRVEKADATSPSIDNSRRELTTAIVHELRGPLSVVTGMARTLGRDWNRLSEHVRKEFLEALERQAGLLMTLSSDLLRLEQAEEDRLDLRPKVVDLRDAVMEGFAATRSRRAISVEVAIEDDTWVYVDTSRFGQAFRNLLANAYRYATQEVSITSERRGDSVLLSIVDDGPGVDPYLVPRLFERFSRGVNADGANDGFGVGLSLVKALITAMGGSVWYEPAVPSGACFRLLLPSGGRVLYVSDPDRSDEGLSSAVTLDGSDRTSASAASRMISKVVPRPA